MERTAEEFALRRAVDACDRAGYISQYKADTNMRGDREVS
jgi:hypothetical protein